MFIDVAKNIISSFECMLQHDAEIVETHVDMCLLLDTQWFGLAFLSSPSPSFEWIIMEIYLILTDEKNEWIAISMWTWMKFWEDQW